MDDKAILFEIKSFDKLLFRYLMETRIKEEKADIFVTPTQMQVIEYIIEHEKIGVYQKDLEKALNLRRATISGVLQTMEKNGLIERCVYLEDTRVKRIILKDKTREMFLNGKRKIKELNDIVIRKIDKKNLEIFRNVLAKMKDNLLQEINKEEETND